MSKVLSIIVPSYNVEKTLETTINSIIKSKSITKIEVIIVNDGSSDKTSEVANSYKEKVPDSIKVINKLNGGHGSTINEGIAACVGKYGFILDGDDWVNTDILDKMVLLLERSKYDIIICDYTDVNEQNKQKKVGKAVGNKEETELTLEEINRSKYFLPMRSIIVNTEILKKIPLISENTFYVDEEYCTYVVSNSKTFFYTGEALYNYRVGTLSQSMNMNNQIDRFDHKIRVLDKLLSYYDYVEGESKIYVQRKIEGSIKNLYEIALLADFNRKRGKSNAIEIKLKTVKVPKIKRFTDKYYFVIRLLNVLHVNYSTHKKITSLIKQLKSKKENKI